MPNIDLSYGGFNLRINYSYSQDINSNTSYVAVDSIQCFTGDQSTVYAVYLEGGSITFNGNTVVSFAPGAYFMPISSGWYNNVAGAYYAGTTVWHNADGTAPGVSVSAHIVYRYEVYSSSSNFYGSSTIGLPTIPRASSISANAVTLGEAMQISVSKASGGFTSTLTWSCGDQSGTIANQDGGTSFAWTPSRDLAAQAPSSGTAPVTLNCLTYSGGTHIGTRSIVVNCPIPADMVPTVSAALSDTKGYPATYGGYVQNQSQLRVVSSAAGSYGSWITGFTVTCQGLTRYSGDCTFGLANSGPTAINVTVTDSRGRTASWAGSINVIPWQLPKVQILSAQRCNEDGSVNPAGGFVMTSFSASVSPVGDRNYAGYSLYHRVRGSADWQHYAGDWWINWYTVNPPEHFLLSFNVDYAYEIMIRATDSFGYTDSTIFVIPVGFAIFDINKNTKSVGILQRASEPNVLAIGADTKHYGHRITDVGWPWYGADAANLDFVWTSITERCFRVGSFYISAINESPASFIGGTWARIQNVFLFGASDAVPVGTVGGEWSHTLTVDEMPSHNHLITRGANWGDQWYGYAYPYNTGPAMDNNGGTVSTGGSQPHNNMPPYYSVYIWQRVG